MAIVTGVAAEVRTAATGAGGGVGTGVGTGAGAGGVGTGAGGGGGVTLQVADVEAVDAAVRPQGASTAVV